MFFAITCLNYQSKSFKRLVFTNILRSEKGEFRLLSSIHSYIQTPWSIHFQETQKYTSFMYHPQESVPRANINKLGLQISTMPEPRGVHCCQACIHWNLTRCFHFTIFFI
jgi:hypothetical protein